MQTTKTKTHDEYVQILDGIVRKLPIERVPQVVDFARFIETQVDEELEEEETAEEIAASEARWDAIVAHPAVQAKLLEMAEEAEAEDDAGLTLEMQFDAEGNLIVPQELEKTRAISSE